ncbi:transposase [Streptomyces sp. NPDC056441]|uniref:transposase n=1 Tax=Streptomyces sp. NPDC056441 TaxID=3345817 RepID=UPI0036CCE0C2
MGSKYTKRYTAEFKRDAIALVDSTGKRVTAVARELGISSDGAGMAAHVGRYSARWARLSRYGISSSASTGCGRAVNQRATVHHAARLREAWTRWASDSLSWRAKQLRGLVAPGCAPQVGEIAPRGVVAGARTHEGGQSLGGLRGRGPVVGVDQGRGGSLPSPGQIGGVGQQPEHAAQVGAATDPHQRLGGQFPHVVDGSETAPDGVELVPPGGVVSGGHVNGSLGGAGEGVAHGSGGVRLGRDGADGAGRGGNGDHGASPQGVYRDVELAGKGPGRPVVGSVRHGEGAGCARRCGVPRGRGARGSVR